MLIIFLSRRWLCWSLGRKRTARDSIVRKITEKTLITRGGVAGILWNWKPEDSSSESSRVKITVAC